MRPTRVSVTSRSVPSPKPWNSRSCIVGISFRCFHNSPSGPRKATEFIQRPRTFYLAFVDADDAVDIELPARSHELLDERPRHLYRRCPQTPHISSNPSNLAA